MAAEFPSIMTLITVAAWGGWIALMLWPSEWMDR